jgi:GNAT superfamily N-acetyltransferase
MSSDVDTRPVGPDELTDLAQLFAAHRTTRHCWCMAFCTTRLQFAGGWFNGGNRRRFEHLATTGSVPMGLLARRAGKSVGWCACGPWSRYERASRPQSKIAESRVPGATTAVWLVPCVFVEAESRGQGVAHRLLGAAVELARREGASAIEGWPLARSVQRSADAFLGREELFDDLGFTCIERPSSERAIMRLDLDAG